MIALTLALVLPGCGTVGTKVFYDMLPEDERPAPGYYSGLRADLMAGPILWNREAPGGPAWTPVLRVYTVLYIVIDVPLSTVADTIILPFEFLVRHFREPAANNSEDETHQPVQDG